MKDEREAEHPSSSSFTLHPSSLDSMAPQFMFATGIENSYPVITGKDGRDLRRDEMESCGHYKQWREDFRLVRELGIEYLRYGPPYYKTHLGPGKYDWSFADETFNALKEMGITPIADLCHFGIPDWIGGFAKPRSAPPAGSGASRTRPSRASSPNTPRRLPADTRGCAATRR